MIEQNTAKPNKIHNLTKLSTNNISISNNSNLFYKDEKKSPQFNTLEKESMRYVCNLYFLVHHFQNKSVVIKPKTILKTK